MSRYLINGIMFDKLAGTLGGKKPVYTPDPEKPQASQLLAGEIRAINMVETQIGTGLSTSLDWFAGKP